MQNPLSALDVDVLKIKNALDTTGFYSIKTEIPFDRFKALSFGLGHITAVNSIKVERDTSNFKKRVYIDSDMEAPFHTDGLYTDYVAWYCIDPGYQSEETLLLDSRTIVAHFSEEEKNQLKNIPYYHLNAGPFPILRSETPLDFYFVPSQISPSEKHGPNLQLLKKVFAVIDQVSQESVIRIQYTQHHCLFINNKLLLHGRGKLDPTTSRHLKRLWIQKRTG